MNSTFAEQQSGSVTTLKFHPLAVKYFHRFLDYCYEEGFRENYVQECTVEAAALGFLGDYLGAVPLEKAAIEMFDESSSSTAQRAEAYGFCKQIGYSGILKTLAFYTEASDFEDIEKFAQIVDIDFFVEVLQQASEFRVSNIIHESKQKGDAIAFIKAVGQGDLIAWIEAVGRYCKVHASTLSYEEFLRITDEKCFPDLPEDIDALFTLLRIEADVLKTVPGLNERSELTALEFRICDAIHECLSYCRTSDRQKHMKWCIRHCPQLALQLWEDALP
ncbi:MAG: hypothetical protein SGARI_001005 [Bacillariaceae sp.]